MSYRKITVDGKTYEYVVGRTHLKIKGFGLFATAEIGNPVRKGRKAPGIDAWGRRNRGDAYEAFVITPEVVRRVIKGESLPLVFHCERHGVSTSRLTTDPFSAEIYGKYPTMVDCGECVQNRAWEI